MARRTDAEGRRRGQLADPAAGVPPRLLPWSDERGRPAYLNSDQPGPLWKLADEMEAVQLGFAEQLSQRIRAEPVGLATPPQELCFMIAALVQALDDSLRVARSRGGRLTPPAPDIDATGEPVPQSESK